MITLNIYPNGKGMPSLIKQQIVDFLRVMWPEGFLGENRLRNWITKENQHPVNFVLSDNNIVISHLEVVWKLLKHEGKIYKTYGLTGVFTYPSFRNQGYGLKLLKEARKYIDQRDADIVMFNSFQKGYYEKVGFERMENVITLVGDIKKPEKAKQCAYMLFLSEKGKKGRHDFENTQVYFGDETW